MTLGNVTNIFYFVNSFLVMFVILYKHKQDISKDVAKMSEFKNTMGNDGKKEQLGHSLLEESSRQTKLPAMYHVLIINDDFTTMEFVVMVLKRIFRKSDKEAVEIMLQTHYTGEGMCGIYTRDIAETKMVQVIDMARANNFPLRCIMRKE